ncbi:MULTISPECIES: hypothetical protein [Burkholderia]|uniref:hypothetical protein n=1 Tax=Burkholderia TaxID=32008 RepID=UPI000755EDBF|nr:MULTISPECIES: hypothetical protein [Burkholderia]AOJ72246.1 hypothetical protein WS78_26325 [Burkholderia savannae]KVG44265.1 hypothetical protein WS77_10055 [Burkholderia sp. MSMB0265]KVG87793.1 hypothetical protein WS81_26040 [Burkholderia sp. MSMB2040]KVG96364.1 hypothetical protein WS83_03115 [Burkholderia sp. MSMB2042]KVG97194.1 hypothetical protein WS82_30265 [Burkholderia sp. MSMB2041]
MAGQQQQQFRNAALALPELDATAAPGVTTTRAQATAARVDASGQVSAIQSLANSFGGFFGNLQGDLQRINAATEQARVADIHKENEALAKQAQADQAAGRAPDEAHANRESYWNAYQQSFAQNQAFEMQQELSARLREMPKDGSVSPEDVAKGVWKDFYGAGTGDADFDSALVGRFGPAAQTMVAQASEQVAQTQEQNHALEIQNSANAQINSPQGLSEAGFATLEQRVLALTRGDQTLADKMIGGFMGSVRNKTQALGLLNALEQSGWADRNPVAYDKMSHDAVQQIQTVKSIQAAQEVDGVRLAAIALKANPNATPEDWAQLVYQANRVDSNHGVGMDKFGPVFQGLLEASKQQATINYMSLAERGYNGSHNIHTIATLAGVDPAEAVKKSFDNYMVQKLQGSGQYPALAASMQGNAGLPDPLASDQAGSEFVGWVTAPGIRDISDGTMPPRIQKDLTSAIKSGDPDRASRAWRVMDRIHDIVGDHAFGQYLGKDDEASGMYWGVKALAPTNGDVSQVYKAIRDGGMDSKVLEKVGNGGSINWEPLLPGKKQADVDVAVNKAMGKAMLDDVGRKGLIWNPATSMSSDLRQQFQGIVIKQLMAQRANGKVDLDTAVANAATVFKGTRMATVGMNGAVKIIEDPFAGKGRAADSPINADPNHPYSITKGYAPIYSSFPMANKANAPEDPFKTAQDDLGHLSKALPGLVPDSAGLSLKRPDRTGLSEIHDSMDNPIILHAGQKLAVRNRTAPQPTTTGAAVPNSAGSVSAVGKGPSVGELVQSEVPSDPKAAAKFFKDNLPPGVFAVYDREHNQYTLNYGFRLQVGDAKAAEIRAEKAKTFRDTEAERRAVAAHNANPLFVR